MTADGIPGSLFIPDRTKTTAARDGDQEPLPVATAAAAVGLVIFPLELSYKR